VSGAIIMAVTYGYDAQENDDHFISMARKVMDLATEVLLPGAHLVNDFPLCMFSCFDKLMLLSTIDGTVQQCGTSLHGSLVWASRKRHSMAHS